MTASSTATTQLLSVNGLRMQVTTAGSGAAGAAVPRLPGAGAFSWRHQVAALAAAGFRVAAPDMRGYGGTDAPPEAETSTRCCTWWATWSTW
jgi:pimeloyl-ACP methyl ester carboxylesterase